MQYRKLLVIFIPDLFMTKTVLSKVILSIPNTEPYGNTVLGKQILMP